VLAVSGATGSGVAAVGEAAERFLAWQEKTSRRQTRHERRMKNVVSIRVKERILRRWHDGPDDQLALVAKEIVAGRLDPTVAVDRLLAAEAGTGRLEGR
jgi:putative protein kinase ArgK-like GTPase of G3E family